MNEPRSMSLFDFDMFEQIWLQAEADTSEWCEFGLQADKYFLSESYLQEVSQHSWLSPKLFNFLLDNLQTSFSLKK